MPTYPPSSVPAPAPEGDPEIRANLRSCFPFIAVPIDQGVSPGFVDSVAQLRMRLKELGIPHRYHQLANDSLITRARMNQLAICLSDPQFTHFVCIDSDLTFKPEDVIKLLHSGHDVCGAAYPLKKHNWGRLRDHVLKKADPNLGEGELRLAASEYVINTYSEDEIVSEVDPTSGATRHVLANRKRPIRNGFVSVSEIGTGFLCVKRTAIMRMMLAYSDDWFTTDIPDLVAMDARLRDLDIPVFWELFNTLTYRQKNSRRFLSEDYAFCQRWRSIGGRVQLMLDCDLVHWGPSAFAGNAFKWYHINQGFEK